jgi:hypothetical protein
VAGFASEVYDRFVLSVFDNMSAAFMNGLVTLRLMKTYPCCAIRYSRLRSSRLHLEHAGRERSHCLKCQKRADILSREGQCYLHLRALTNVRVWKLVVSSSVVALCYNSKALV